MTTPYVLQGGLVLDPASKQESVMDLRLDGDRIVALGGNLEVKPGDTAIDARGLWICPGFIDLHCHLRDLGQKDKEDIETGTRAAAAGGYTTVVAMANTEPPVDNAATLSVLLNRIADRAHIEVLPVACVTKGMEGAELTNMVELAEMGAVAFSDDGLPISNMAVLRRALEYARLSERVIISHAEDRDLCQGGIIHEGARATAMGLSGIPIAGETVAIAREIEIVRSTNSPYHFTHLSCAQSVELVRRAKADGLPVTADATPHHLTLTVDQIQGWDANYKMKPPLRTQIDQEALIAGLKDGTLDAIATDHAPHTRQDKCRPLEEASVGVIGLETALALTLERLVGAGHLRPLEFIALFTSKAAPVLDLPQPSLQIDSTANIAIVDPALRWTYSTSTGQSRSHNSPFHGRLLTGKNILTFYQGRPVFTDKQALQNRLKEPV